MWSPKHHLLKRSFGLRHAQVDAPNVLKARFSPTAIWTTLTEADPAATEEPAAARTTVTRATRTAVVTTPRVTATRVPTTSQTVPLPVTTSATAAPTSLTTSSSLAIPTTTSSIVPSTTSSSVVPTTTSSTPTTALVTKTVSSSGRTVASASGTALDSASSSTPGSTSSSGMSTAGIIGIAAAGILGAAIIAGLIVFCVRRNRRKNRFDPDDFRRQSVVLRDDSATMRRGNSNNRGPRPPTMFERHNQNVAAFSTTPLPSNVYQPASQPYGTPNPFNDFAMMQQSSPFTPGLYVPTSASTGQYVDSPPFFNSAYQSPSGVPVSAASYGNATMDGQGRLVRAPSNATTAMLSRNPSMANTLHPADEAEYADLSRASVTPFQAAQYAAISKQLNIPPPKPLPQVSEADEVTQLHNTVMPSPTEKNLPPTLVSPFETAHIGSDQRTNQATAEEVPEKIYPSRASSEFHASDSFLPPPNLADRIASLPPSLPEIRMSNGSFSPVTYSFPVTPSPCNASFVINSGRASPKVDLPSLSPVPTSPQRAQFNDGLEARAHNGHETPVEVDHVSEGATPPKSHTQASSKVETQTAAPKRPETVYDVEDAYGGI